MISRIHGTLESIGEGKAEVSLAGGLTYELLMPAFAAGRLGGSIGQPVTLHTVHYIEAGSQSSNFTPRLAGFLSVEDRAFFTLFTSVKGIGPRKALRAMAMATAQIAGAIADRDVKTLQALPEIGKRTAESIVAELHGKVDRYLTASPVGAGSRADGSSASIAPKSSAAREAIEVLVQLGENRVQALRWIDEVLVRDPGVEQTQALVTEVLRLKAGGPRT